MKKYINKILTVTLTFLIALTTITGVEASSVGHGQGGVGSGASGYWRRFSGKRGQVWNKFLNERNTYNHLSKSEMERWIDSNLGNPKLTSICKESDAIWAYWGPRPDGKGSMWQTKAGSTNKVFNTNDMLVTKKEKQYWKDYIRMYGKAWNQGRVVLICSGEFIPDIVPKERIIWRDKTWVNDGKANESVVGYWETELTISPRTPEEGFANTKEKSIWRNSARTQRVSSNSQGKTAFRNYVEKNDPKKIKTKAEWDRWVAGAKKVANNAPELTYTLNDENYTAFMYGRVFDISESRRKRIISAPFTFEKEVEYQYVEIIDANTGKVIEKAKKTGKRRDTGERRTKVGNVTNRDHGEFVFEHAYQIMNVRCNGDEFKKVLKASGASDRSIALGEGSGALETKKYKSVNSLPLGNAKHPNADLRKTGTLQFFTETKGCENALVCSNQPLGSNAKNNANENLIVNGEGAQAYINGSNTERKSLKSIEIFRSNEEGKDGRFRMNVSYPKLINNKSVDIGVNPNDPAKNTILFVNEGTPVLGNNIALIKGKKQGGGSVDIKRGGRTNTSGHVNKFDARSAWASDDKDGSGKEGKGHEISAVWEYEGKLYTNVPKQVTSNQAKNWQKESSPLEMFCPYREGVSNEKPVVGISTLHHIRPAGTESTADRVQKLVKHYVEVVFVRAVSSN